MASAGKPSLTAAFPLLNITNYRITSPPNRSYNCIAWAAGEDNRWWWPDAALANYWPDGIPRQATVDAFVQAYQTIGYLVCTDGFLEKGMEKIAIYSKNGVPTHAARQLRSGRWTSKLGNADDIEHNAAGGVEGNAYGRIAIYLSRRSRT
jgi:hypothetical protein